MSLGRGDCNIAAVLGHKFGNWTLIDGVFGNKCEISREPKRLHPQKKETTTNILKQLLVGN